MKNYLLLLAIIILCTCCIQNEYESKEPPLPKEVDSLFIITTDNSFSFDVRKHAIIEIENYLAQRQNDSTKRRNYFKVANRYYNLNDREGEFKSAKTAYQLALEVKDTTSIARSYLYFGEYYLRLNEMDSAFYYNYKASQFYEVTKDNNTQRRALSNLSYFFQYAKDYVKSEMYAVEALKVVQKYDNSLAKYGVYNTLGHLFGDIGKFDLSYQYHLKALESTKIFKGADLYYQPRLESQSLLNIGVLNMKQGNYEKAGDYFLQVEHSGVLYKENPSNYAYLLENKAYNNHKLGKTDVMSVFNKALKIHDSVDVKYRGFTELLIAKYYNEINKLDSSFHHAQKAYIISKKNGVLNEELKALHLMALTDRVTRQIQWYETYIKLQDSLTDQERRQQEKFAMIEHDTENLTIEKQIAVTQRDQAKSRFWMVLAISLFLVSIGVLVYFNRLRKLKNKELQVTQKELEANENVYNIMLDQQFKIEQGKHLEKKRIAQELHDGVLGKLSGIRLNLFVLNKKKDQQTIEHCLPYIKSLQEVEKEIRSITHNLSEDMFSDQIHFTTMVSGMFENIAGHTDLKLQIFSNDLIDWNIIPTSSNIEIYRILQEGLHNIVKHAQAQNVMVRMTQTDTYISIDLADDGIGLPKDITSKGIGLKNMKERAVKIGALLDIETDEDKGTVFSISISKNQLGSI